MTTVAMLCAGLLGYTAGKLIDGFCHYRGIRRPMWLWLVLSVGLLATVVVCNGVAR